MLYRADNAPRPSRQQRVCRRRYRKRQHDNAVERALLGAGLWKGLPVTPRTQAEAARLVGSTPQYIAAAAALVEAEDPGLIQHVLTGRISLLEAAETVRKRVRLVKAYREADRNDRQALGKAIGVDTVFDEIVGPHL
jgi:hypothetical protein